MPVVENAEISDIIAAVQASVGALAGIRRAPDAIPERLNVFPFAVAFPVSGVIERESAWLDESHTIALEIHLARKDLPRDILAAMPYVRSVPNALWSDPTLAGTVETLEELIYSFGSLDWADDKTLGFRFELGVRQMVAVSEPTWDLSSGPDNPTLLQAITQIQSLVASSVRQAPATPPEQMSVFPFAVAYPRTGRIQRQTDWRRELHTITLEIHVARKSLRRDVEKSFPFARSIPQLLCADPTLNYKVATVNQIRYTFGSLNWAGPEGEVPTIGFRFEIDAKINVNG